MTLYRQQRWITIGGICLLALSALPASAAPSLSYVTTLPGPDRAAGLNRPGAVTIDPVAGEICVTDEGSATLHAYNRSGVRTFETGNAAGLAAPKDGSIDCEGGFVITDSNPPLGRTIKRLSLFGEPLAYEAVAPRPEWFPAHLLLTRQGDFVSVDAHNWLVTKHDGRTGSLIWQTELSGHVETEAGPIGRPAEAPDGKLLIPMGSLHYVLVLSPDGEVVSSFGQSGGNRGEFLLPVGVACGFGGNILVLDRIRHAVLIFDAQQKFLSEYSSFGAGPGSFYHPVAIAAAGNLVYVAQGYEGRVQVFRLTDREAQLPESGPSS